jgi:hypothetical protein
MALNKYLHRTTQGNAQKRSLPVVNKSNVIRDVLRNHGLDLATNEVRRLCAQDTCYVSASEVERVRHEMHTHSDDREIERELKAIQRVANIFNLDLSYTQAVLMAVSSGVTDVSEANLVREEFLLRFQGGQQ